MNKSICMMFVFCSIAQFLSAATHRLGFVKMEAVPIGPMVEERVYVDVGPFPEDVLRKAISKFTVEGGRVERASASEGGDYEIWTISGFKPDVDTFLFYISNGGLLSGGDLHWIGYDEEWRQWLSETPWL